MSTGEDADEITRQNTRGTATRNPPTKGSNLQPKPWGPGQSGQPEGRARGLMRNIRRRHTTAAELVDAMLQFLRAPAGNRWKPLRG